jgi:predicted TIM-barrel fold metal-dependent hydrolase
LIIDAHCHIGEKRLLPKVFLEPFQQLAKAWGCDPQLLLDGSVERLIREMDEANIDKSVLLVWDTTLSFPGGVSFKEYNDYAAKILRENPSRFIGFCGIDPRRGTEAIQERARDWPCFTPIYSQRDWVEHFKTRELPQYLKEIGLSSFTDKEKKMILGGNAKKIFNL